jgi:hypothetical protein
VSRSRPFGYRDALISLRFRQARSRSTPTPKKSPSRFVFGPDQLYAAPQKLLETVFDAHRDKVGDPVSNPLCHFVE